MPCSHIENCDLFAQFALNPALDLWKEHYCKNEFIRCVRFQNSSKGLAVPLTLLPNGTMVSVVHSSEEMGAVAIFNAITKGRAHMVSSLLKAGANINAKNIEGKTPLMVAAELNSIEIVEFLIKKNADSHARNLQNQTAYDIAIKKGHAEVAAFLRPHCNRLVAV